MFGPNKLEFLFSFYLNPSLSVCAVSCLCGLAHCGGGIICGDIIITLVTTIIIVRFDTFILILIHCGGGIVCVCVHLMRLLVRWMGCGSQLP